MKNRNSGLLVAMFITVLAMVSCSKWDDYQKYTEEGETLYTGKLDSAIVYSGRQRVKLRGLLPADPKIVKMKVTWNDNKDSVIFPITKGIGVEVFEKIFSVEEGIKNFVIQTFDAVGNGSVLVKISGVVYGPRYESGLINRPALSAELLPTGNIEIKWDTFDTTTSKGTITEYTNSSNNVVSVFTPGSQSLTVLPNFKPGGTISYRTLYLPTPTTIDTFYAAKQALAFKYEITGLYLSNTGPNFQRDAFDGRWGTLAAPWVTNAAAKNKGGLYGGYSSDAGGVINWETWGNTPVVDGIVYQPTSAPLPAGKYIVSFDEYSEIQANSTIYCVAAAGGSGIPVLANLSTAVGFVGAYNGATIGQTGPSATDTRSFSFVLTAPQVVSIGFVANIVGNGNPGSYIQIKKLQLFSNN